jgi:DNA-directed RNA polymerase specialized sigma subunit
MFIIESYKDLLTEIEILEYLQTDLNRQIKHAHHVLWSGKLPSQPSPAYIGLDKSLARYASLTERLIEVEYEMGEKRKLKAKMDEKFRGLEGIEYIVAFKRQVEGKSLKEIAVEMGYTEGWIKQVSMKANRMIRKERTNNEPTEKKIGGMLVL